MSSDEMEALIRKQMKTIGFIQRFCENTQVRRFLHSKGYILIKSGYHSTLEKANSEPIIRIKVCYQ